MTTALWLRISAVLTLLFCLAHTLGYPWVGQLTADQLAQMDGINTIKVATQGFARSYADFHKGFGLYISAMLLAQAVIFWRLGSLAGVEPRSARFVAALSASVFAATVALDFFYFFWGPIIFSAVIMLTLGAAFVARRDA
jgi:hypothetical protein